METSEPAVIGAHFFFFRQPFLEKGHIFWLQKVQGLGSANKYRFVESYLPRKLGCRKCAQFERIFFFSTTNFSTTIFGERTHLLVAKWTQVFGENKFSVVESAHN